MLYCYACHRYAPMCICSVEHQQPPCSICGKYLTDCKCRALQTRVTEQLRQVMEVEESQFKIWSVKGHTPERLLDTLAARNGLEKADVTQIKVLFDYIRWLKDLECEVRLVEAEAG